MARLAAGLALVVVGATLVDDAVQASALSHPRSVALYASAIVLAAALLTLAPLAGSLAVSIGAGVAGGGALATPIAAALWHGGVPNPLVRGDVAFNVSDVAIALGVALLIGGALLHAWRNRAVLRRPVGGARRSE